MSVSKAGVVNKDVYGTKKLEREREKRGNENEEVEGEKK